MAKVLLVVSRRYNGHELWVTLGTLVKRGHEFEVVSTSLVLEDEINGKMVRVKRLQKDVPNLDGFDGLMYVSGNMQDTEANWYNPDTERMTLEAKQKDMPMAAICCSVPALRWAINGLTVSCFPLQREIAIINKAGATVAKVGLSVDKKIVTAEHQMATQSWVETFCEVLEGKVPDLERQEAELTVGTRRRRGMKELDYIRGVVDRTGKTGLKDDVPSK